MLEFGLLILESLGYPLPYLVGVRTWLTSESMRWLPGGVWKFASRVVAAQNLRYPVSHCFFEFAGGTRRSRCVLDNSGAGWNTLFRFGGPVHHRLLQLDLTSSRSGRLRNRDPLFGVAHSHQAAVDYVRDWNNWERF